METKVCTRCIEELPVTEFYETKKGSGVYRSNCKVCSGIMNVTYIKDTRERYLKSKARKTPERIAYEKEYQKEYCKRKKVQRGC